LLEILRESDLEFLRSAPRSAPTDAGLRFLSSGPSGTLRERFARRLPNSIGHVGTVRGLFRPIEARTSSLECSECADFSAFSLCVIGAGEGIRTLDPDLGKVVLYP
jgi:hypothetical protein